MRDGLVGGMPVNYHARYVGDVRRVLDALDTLADDHPRVRRPLQRVLREAPEVAEQILALILIHAYRRGDLP